MNELVVTVVVPLSYEDQKFECARRAYRRAAAAVPSLSALLSTLSLSLSEQQKHECDLIYLPSFNSK